MRRPYAKRHADQPWKRRGENDQHQRLDRFLPQALVDDEQKPDENADRKRSGFLQPVGKPGKCHSQDDRRQQQQHEGRALHAPFNTADNRIKKPLEISDDEIDERLAPWAHRNLVGARSALKRIHRAFPSE